MTDNREIWFLDIASRTGIARGAPGSIPRLSSMKFSRSDDDSDNARELANGRAASWLLDTLRLAQAMRTLPRAIWCEAPINPAAPSRNSYHVASSLPLIALWGALTGCAGIYSVPCRSIHVATVRKFFLGPGVVGNIDGDAQKRRTFDYCLALGWSPSNMDESDAAAGWLWACALYDRKVSGPPAHLWEGALL